MDIVLPFSALCILLVVGKILRVTIRLFQKLYLPASVIGGLLGLVLVQTIGGSLPEATTAGWTRLPGFLINIVFSALFLGVFIPPIRRIWGIAGPQLAYGQIVAWGQYVVGLGVAIVLLTPVFGVPGAIGTIIPVGFEGGHGTAAGLEPVFDAYDWPEGRDLALTSATCGVLFAIIVGMALVNWAARRGYTRQLKRIEDMPESSIVGVYDPAERPSAGSQTVSAASIDSLGFHLAIIGLGVFIGYLIHSGLVRVEFLVRPPSADGRAFFDSFPLFPLCMIGGLVVQLFFANFTTRNPLGPSPHAAPLGHRHGFPGGGCDLDHQPGGGAGGARALGDPGRRRGAVERLLRDVASAPPSASGFVVRALDRRDGAVNGRHRHRALAVARRPIPKATPMRPRPSATSSSCTSRSWAVGCGPAPPFRWRWPTIRWWYSASAPGQWRSGCWCGRCCFAVGSASGDRKAPLTLSRVASPAPRIIR